MKDFEYKLWSSERKRFVNLIQIKFEKDPIEQLIRKIYLFTDPKDPLRGIQEGDDSNFTLLRYTGILDDKDIPIFEKDIVLITEKDQSFVVDNNEWNCYKAEIKWHKAAFVIDSPRLSHEELLYNKIILRDWDEISIQVIGNMYENSENYL